ncbi:MAG: hypothetical protein KDK37_19085, partial [Leptospiraceae bacterium]|nr:hypothetical protein [Leptospiraceae bacterium]
MASILILPHCNVPSKQTRLQYHIDHTRALSISNMEHWKEWQVSDVMAPAFGFSDGDLWIRLAPNKNSSSVGFDVLDIYYSQLDSVSVFYRTSDGKLTEKKSGDTESFGHRDIITNSFAFDVSNAIGPIFVRIRTEGTLMAPLSVYSRSKWNEALQRRTILYGLYFGALLLMALYNFFLFISIRDRTYLYYSIYVLLVFLSFFSFLGFSHQYLWPQSGFWNNKSFVVTAFLYVIASLQFALRYLGVRESIRRLWATMRLLQLAFVPIIAMALIGDYHLATRIGSALNILSSALIFLGAIWRTSSGYRPARTFLVAWS